MTKLSIIAGLILLMMTMAFSMNYIFGLGYSPNRGWVYDLGAMNGFSDEISLKIFTAASTSQATIYKVNAYIPLLGRNDKNIGYRLGPAVVTEISTTTSFSVGIYAQYYLGPWRMGLSLMKPLKKNGFQPSFDLWYFFSSQGHNFIDYLVAEVQVGNPSSISLFFIEPF